MNVSEVQRRANGDQAPRQVGKGAAEGAWFFREARRGVGGTIRKAARVSPSRREEHG